jgi:serine/threonine protein kinase
MLADQMLKRLEFLHRKEYIHRSISLRKWVMGEGETSKKLYLVGLSRSKHYLRKGQHLPYSEGKPFLGQSVYASVNCHLGIEPTRRDDLESMLYCWAKMLYGQLPWEKEEDLDRMLSRKMEQRSEVLFANCPRPLIEIGRHIQGLSFAEAPDYQAMGNLILELYQHYDLECTYRYDWEPSDSPGLCR